MNLLSIFAAMPKVGDIAEQVQVKGWWKSKQQLLLIFTAAITILAQLFNEYLPLTPAEINEYALSFTLVVLFFVRFITKGPIGMRHDGESDMADIHHAGDGITEHDNIPELHDRD